MNEPIRTSLSHPTTLRSVAALRPAAVALVLDPSDRLLLLRRPRRSGDPWSGQIALPGGHLRAGESHLEAARRETHEELGLSLPLDPIARLPERHTPLLRPTHRVRPFVFRVGPLQPLQPDPKEVAAFQAVPLHVLAADRTHFRYRHHDVDHTLPCIELELGRLWGLTLRFVDDLLQFLGRATLDPRGGP